MPDNYDPAEIEDRPTRSHLTRKDLRVFVVAIAVLAALMTPIYMILKRQRDKHVCKQNVHQIYKALVGYAILNDDRFPPLFVAGEGGEPAFPNANRRPYTWMTLIQPGLSVRSNFQCPSAEESEHVVNLPYDPDGKPFLSNYGMYRPWATWNMTMVINQDRSVLFSETSNNGANDTFDPNPFSHGVDGMVIGFDTGNEMPSDTSEFVTRLAFADTKNGQFKSDGPTRHAGGNHAISISGSLIHLKPSDARIQRLSATASEIVNYWATR